MNTSFWGKSPCLITREIFSSSRCFGVGEKAKPKPLQEVREVLATEFALKSKGATQLNLGQQLQSAAFHNYCIYWFGERYETLFGWAWTSPTKNNNSRLWAGRQWGLHGFSFTLANPPSPSVGSGSWTLIASNAGWGHSFRNPTYPYPNKAQNLQTLKTVYKISCLIKLLYHSRAWI